MYDNKVREAVLDRILEDGMSVERVIASMGRDFLLNLSDGFVDDCLDWQIRRLDLADHRRWVLDHFSGTLCVDELHLGQMTLLLATDPLNDLPVAFALVASNDQPHMRRFLKNLKTWGLSPAVVVTDGSNLDPRILAELWPDARHQLCVFHVLKDLHEQVLDAVRRQRRAMSRRGHRGRQQKRGRRPNGRAKRQGLTNKEKSSFVHRHRHLIVKRREKMTRQERIDLATMQSYLPELKVLRDFVDRLEMLFAEGQSEALAWGRHTALVVNRHFLGVPELATALEMLAAEKFAKMIAFLKSQVCQRVRTNNHVERVNRKLRYEEKSRYKWRTRHTTVRFLVLLMDRYWRRERAIWNRWPDEPNAGCVIAAEAAQPALKMSRSTRAEPLTGSIFRGSGCRGAAWRLFEEPDLLFQHPLHPVPGDEDMSDRHPKFLGGVGTMAVLDRREPEGLPRERLHALFHPAHGELEQFAVEGILELLLKIGQSVVRIGESFDETSRPVGRVATGSGQVAPRMLGHRLEPGPEAAGRVVLEFLDRSEQFDQHLLRDVVGIRGLCTGPQAPRVDHRPIALNKLIPGPRIDGVLLDPYHQRGRRIVIGLGRHRRGPRSDSGGRRRRLIRAPCDQCAIAHRLRPPAFRSAWPA